MDNDDEPGDAYSNHDGIHRVDDIVSAPDDADNIDPRLLCDIPAFISQHMGCPPPPWLHIAYIPCGTGTDFSRYRPPANSERSSTATSPATSTGTTTPPSPSTAHSAEAADVSGGQQRRYQDQGHPSDVWSRLYFHGVHELVPALRLMMMKQQQRQRQHHDDDYGHAEKPNCSSVQHPEHEEAGKNDGSVAIGGGGRDGARPATRKQQKKQTQQKSATPGYTFVPVNVGFVASLPECHSRQVVSDATPPDTAIPPLSSFEALPPPYYFINIASVGLGAQVCGLAERLKQYVPGLSKWAPCLPWNKLAYMIASASCLISMRQLRVRLVELSPEFLLNKSTKVHAKAPHVHTSSLSSHCSANASGTRTEKGEGGGDATSFLSTRNMAVTTMAFCNGQCFGGGMKISPLSDVTDGSLRVAVWQAGFFGFLSGIPSVYNGKATLKWRNSHYFKGRYFFVSAVDVKNATRKGGETEKSKEESQEEDSEKTPMLPGDRHPSYKGQNAETQREAYEPQSKGASGRTKSKSSVGEEKQNLRDSFELDGELRGKLPAVVGVATHTISFLAPCAL